MMLAPHSNPIEISSPELVLSPLWQGTPHSHARKKVPGGVLSPFAFSVCDWANRIAGTAITASPSATAPTQRSLISNHSITSHPHGPTGDRTPPAAFAPVY